MSKPNIQPMADPIKQCKTCAYAAKRYRGGRLHLVCTRYPARSTDVTHCIDYRALRTAVAKVLDYLKRTSLK